MSTSNDHGDAEYHQSTLAPFTITGTNTSALSGAAVSFVSVAVPTKNEKVSISFDPVSAEARRQTRELNQVIRLGFKPPVSSTR